MKEKPKRNVRSKRNRRVVVVSGQNPALVEVGHTRSGSVQQEQTDAVQSAELRTVLHELRVGRKGRVEAVPSFRFAQLIQFDAIL